MSLCIFRLKPNPAGKDRSPTGSASATQLGGEWVDIKNIGTQSVNISGLRMDHKAYSSNFNFTWTEVMTFKGMLAAGTILRVHAGSGPKLALRPSDIKGANFHLFTNKNYVWNNRFSDAARLVVGTKVIDNAAYSSTPPDGVVLQRQGAFLVVMGGHIAW